MQLLRCRFYHWLNLEKLLIDNNFLPDWCRQCGEYRRNFILTIHPSICLSNVHHSPNLGPWEAQSGSWEAQARPWEAQARPLEAQARPWKAQVKPWEAQAWLLGAQAKPWGTPAIPWKAQDRPEEA